MRKFLSLALAICVASRFAMAADEHAEWEKYETVEYGLSMKIPKGAKVLEREKSGGWGGLQVKHEGVELNALAKLAVFADPDEIHKFAEKECGISAKNWTKVDSGKDKSGWKWYEIYEASHEGTLIFAGMGTGPKGSYLLFLKTTKEDYEKHKPEYKEWFASVRLFEKKE